MTAVFWLKQALADLRGIHDYIARDNPAAARRVIKKVRDGVDVLKEHPGIGRAGRLEGTRELVIGQYPYIVAPAGGFGGACPGGGTYLAPLARAVALA